MKKSVILLWAILVAFSGFGQKKKAQDDRSKEGQTELTEQESLKVETIIIEAEKELIINNSFKALELFKEALELDPNNAVVNYKIADIYLHNNEGHTALPYAEKAIAIDGSNLYFYQTAAKVYESIFNYSAAADLYEKMIQLSPESEQYYYHLSLLYQQYIGDDKKALETYRKAEEVFGMEELLLIEKQKIYLKNRDYKSLMADWDQLIAENPDEPAYVIELCEILLTINMTSEARERLEKITNHQQANLLLSQIYLVEGKVDQAMGVAKNTMQSEEVDYMTKLQLLNGFLDRVIKTEEFEEIESMAKQLAEMYPDQYAVQAFAGDLMYRLENVAAARMFYVRAVKLQPSNYGVWQNILTIESEMSEYDSVVAHAEAAMEYFPNQAPLYYFAGTGHLINKEYHKSIRMLEQGRKFASDPKLITVFYGQMGDAYNGLKNHEKSYEAYENALKADPDNDHVLNNYSFYLSLRKIQMDKALQMSTRLVAMHPENPTYLDTHGWVLYVMKRYDEAMVYLRKAANLLQDGTIIEHYGDVLYKLGKVDDAIQQWKRASKYSDASKNIEKKIADRKLYE